MRSRSTALETDRGLEQQHGDAAGLLVVHDQLLADGTRHSLGLLEALGLQRQAVPFDPVEGCVEVRHDFLGSAHPDDAIGAERVWR